MGSAAATKDMEGTFTLVADCANEEAMNRTVPWVAGKAISAKDPKGAFTLATDGGQYCTQVAGKSPNSRCWRSNSPVIQTGTGELLYRPSKVLAGWISNPPPAG